MKRRDALAMIPGAAVGVRSFWKTGVFLKPGRLQKNPPGAPRSLRAEIKIHHGRPVLFLNDRPVFAGIYWVTAPTPDRWDFSRQAHANKETGIHIYAFDVGKGTEWIGPKTSPQNPFDFSTVEARFGRILDADPEALFHLRIYLETGHADWWENEYPQECEILSDGRKNGQSFASQVWREQAKSFLRAYAKHFERIGLADRVLSYQVGAGHTGEWVKGESSMHKLCGDYSEPMRQHFRSWLRNLYHGDRAEFRRSWNQPNAAFETAEVPGAEAQLLARHYTFRDPAAEQSVIDYFRCLAELCADCVIDFCQTAKEAGQGKKLAGAFYGYLMDLSWNGGFFRERPDIDYSTYQRSGHLGLRKVLASSSVDFLVSPYSYGYRGVGGDGPSMLPSESVRLHGKLCLVEDDTRTHVDLEDVHYGRANSLPESIALLRRNLAQDLTHGQGVWWASWKVDPVKEPAFAPLLRSFQTLGTFALDLDLTPSAEIGVFIDDESFYYESCRYDLDIPLIFQQRLWGLPKTGAPFDLYLLQDLVEGRIKPYKLYVFLNAFRLDEKRREAIKRQIRSDKRTSLWIYAPGYIENDLSLDNIEELTGLRLGLGEQPWGPLVHITDFNHPITAGLSQDLVWGTNNKLAPIFHVSDPEAKILGQVVYSQGDCKPGFAIKSYPGWTSIYSAAPNLPAAVLRNIARFAGVHIFNEAGDVLYATPQLLGVHTVSGGPRIFKLRQAVEEVYDLFEHKTLARDADVFRVTLPPVSSALYFTGASGLLSRLKKPLIEK